MKPFLAVLIVTTLILSTCAKWIEPIINKDILEIDHIYSTTGYARDVYISDSLVYIAEDQAGFSIYDRNNDTLICHYYGSIENARLISAVEEESLLFIYDIYGSPAAISVFEISDLSDPMIKPAITGDTGDIEAMKCQVVIEGVIDILWTRKNVYRYGSYEKNNAQPWLGSYAFPPFPNAVKGFDLDSLFIYIAGDQRGLYIADKNNGNFISETNTPGRALEVKVVGNYAYIADKETGLQVINISDIENPELIYSFDTSGYAQSVDVEEDYLVVGSGGGGVYLFDVSDKATPKFLDRIDDSEIGYTYKAFLSNMEVFAATKIGVVKLKIND